MKIISIIQQKGGAGKTTLALHLAHELKLQFPNLRIAIADADPQESASNWVKRGQKRGIHSVSFARVANDQEGKGLKADLDKIDSDITIIDLPPRIESLSLRAALYSDLMLVPVGASVLDMEAARSPISVCEEAIALKPEKKFLLVPTKIQSHTNAGREIREALAKWGPVSKSGMALRVAYSDSATAGEGVSTFAPGSPAHEEVKIIAKETAKILELMK